MTFSIFEGHHRVPHPQISLVAYKHQSCPTHTFSWRNKASNNPHQNQKVRDNPPSLSPPTPTLWTLFLPPLLLPTKTLVPPHQQHPHERNSDSGSAEFGHRVQRCPSKQQIDRCRPPQMTSTPPMFRMPSPPPPR
jgi:hypothetical protein